VTKPRLHKGLLCGTGHWQARHYEEALPLVLVLAYDFAREPGMESHHVIACAVAFALLMQLECASGIANATQLSCADRSRSRQIQSITGWSLWAAMGIRGIPKVEYVPAHMHEDHNRLGAQCIAHLGAAGERP